MYEKRFYFLLNSSFPGKMVFMGKLKLIYPSFSQHYNNCSALTFLILFKKFLDPPPFVKKTSNLIKSISSHKICSEIKSQQVKKHSVPKTFDFSQNYFVPFHRFTIDHSISCVFLMDKPNESCQIFKNLKEMSYPPQEKLLKRKGNSITQAITNAPISQTSSESLKLPSKHLLILKTSSRHVLKTSSTRLQRNNFTSSKTS